MSTKTLHAIFTLLLCLPKHNDTSDILSLQIAATFESQELRLWGKALKEDLALIIQGKGYRALLIQGQFHFLIWQMEK